MGKFVCNCRNVTKAEITNAIRRYNVVAVHELQALTRASTGCGRCRPTIAKIVEAERAKLDVVNCQLRLPF